MGTAASPLLNPTADSPNGVGHKPAAEVRLRRTQQRRQIQGVIASINLDRFKRINDTYAHPIGDEVHRALAIMVFADIRGVDRFGHYGGEDSLLVLPDMSSETAVRTLDRLRTIASPVPEFDHSSPRTKKPPRVQPKLL
jgi:diguanylate cyclase (GGDEF)-like protein